jgi:5'-nucleotidase
MILIILKNFLIKNEIKQGESMSNILIVNDDGYFAPGIQFLKKELQRHWTVKVLAPHKNCSAISHGITLERPLRLIPTGNAEEYMLDGTPADCVKFALNQLWPGEIDLVVSGINAGVNTGVNVLYSGTVAGGLEALVYSVPSIGFSLQFGDKMNYAGASAVATKLVRYFMKNPFPKGLMMNVNFPQNLEDALLAKGRHGNSYIKVNYEKRRDPRGGDYYWLSGNELDNVKPGSDDDAILKGKISLTPLKYDFAPDTKEFSQYFESLPDNVKISELD